MKNYIKKIEQAKEIRHTKAEQYLTNCFSHMYHEVDTAIVISRKTTEYNGAEISVILQNKKPKPLNESDIRINGSTMVRAIDYMKKSGYMLFDIKSESIANKKNKESMNTNKLELVFLFYGSEDGCKICNQASNKQGGCSDPDCSINDNGRICDKCFNLHLFEEHRQPEHSLWGNK